MAISTSDAIFLGNFADADTDEGTYSVENTGIYQNTFGSVGAPLSSQIISVDYDDVDNDGSLPTDNVGPVENISYDAGGGPVTAVVDSLAVVSLTVTYSNGSSQSFSNAVMYQASNGDLFLTNSNWAGTDLNGTNNLPIQSITVTSIETNYTGIFQNAFQSFVCFAAGTMLDTPLGPRRIEDIRLGDLVTTVDDGPQVVRWIGLRRVRLNERTAPVRITAGALGNNLPCRDLWVTQQHRLLVRSKIAKRMFETSEVLIPAKRFIGQPGFALDQGRTHMTYGHLMFDRHQIVLANGAPAESLFPGPQALKMMGHAARDEIMEIFPELASSAPGISTARLVPEGKRQRALCARHAKNQRKVLEMI